MYNVILKLSVFVIVLSFFSCKKSEPPIVKCLKGKLVLQGICMNYVIEITEGSIDTTLYETKWTNPMNGVEFKNVFALGSICTFPPNIKEGDSFYFKVLKSRPDATCVNCKAYSPTPNKSLYIEICN